MKHMKLRCALLIGCLLMTSGCIYDSMAETAAGGITHAVSDIMLISASASSYYPSTDDGQVPWPIWKPTAKNKPIFRALRWIGYLMPHRNWSCLKTAI